MAAGDCPGDEVGGQLPPGLLAHQPRLRVTRRALARGAAGLAVAVTALVGAAVPASAHTVSGQGATNYRTQLVGVSPPVAGLRAAVVDGGSLVQVTWTETSELIILGYEGEPYLRLGPDGIFRNRLSPATYLNVTRTYGAVPPYADAKAAPQWVRLSGGHTVRYHDHRIHWMGGPTPPEVARAPGAVHRVSAWAITMVESGRQVRLTGYLDWVPGSSPWPWVGVIVALAVAGGLVGASRSWAYGLLVFTVALIGADVVHALGTGLFVAGSAAHKALFMFTGSYYSAIAWALGVVSARLLARRSVDGLFAAIFTALVIGLFGGLADIITLARSQVPFVWGTTVDRAVITASTGLGAGLFVGALIAFRSQRPSPAISNSDETAAPRPTEAPDLL